jgi:transposase-like protein
VTTDGAARRRAFYGIAEIADALGMARQLVTVWRRRRSRGMPEPDAELSSGPIWRGETIEPWIDQVRAELGSGPAAEPLGPKLARRVSRRILRLLVLLLEEQPRIRPLTHALAEAAELRPVVSASAQDDVGRAARAVLAALDPEPGRPGVSGVDDPGPPEGLRLRLLAVLPLVAVLNETADESAGLG